MLNCRELVQETTANPDILDGGRLRLGVRLHLMMCRYCRRYVRQLQRLLAMLRRQRDSDKTCPPETVERVLAEIRQAESKQPGPPAS